MSRKLVSESTRRTVLKIAAGIGGVLSLGSTSAIAQSNEIEIEDWNDLDAVREDQDSDHVLANDLTPETDGYDEVVESSDTGFTPINYFTGSFDGQNNTIEQLVVDEHPDDDVYAVGLFSRVAEEGEIRNVELEDINVTGEQSVGGLVGEATGGTVSNTSVSGNITVLADGGNVGGLVGVLRSEVGEENTEGTIIDSSVDGSVTHNGAGGTTSHAGGLVGSIGPNSEIRGSSVSATVTGEGDGIRVGGLIGTSSGTITDVSASGDVIGETTTGGLIGFVTEGTVEEASASGDVTGSTNTGGCFGLFGDADDEAVAVNVSASGEVQGNEGVGGLAGSLAPNSEMTNVSATGSVEGNEDVGGLVGSASGDSITGATATGNVSGTEGIGGLVGSNTAVITECRATGDIESEGSAGGLAGLTAETSINRSVATGDVDSTGQSVGGLVGSIFPDAQIEDSYAVGNVQSTDGQVGGLAGGNNGKIDTCFATGAVDGDFLVGGLVGNGSDGTVTESYWDTEASDQDESPVGEGLITAQMQGEAASENLAGFDFEESWDTVTEPDNYPILSWQDEPVEQPEDEDIEGDVTVTLNNDGSSAWQVTNINGDGGIAPLNEDNPTLTLEPGTRYLIENNGWDAHPLAFRNEAGEELLTQDGEGTFEDESAVEWVDEGGELAFTLTEILSAEMNSYVCTVHTNAMAGNLSSSVDLRNVTLDDNTIAGDGSTHSLSFDVFNLSPDDDPDKFTIQMPENVDVDSINDIEASNIDIIEEPDASKPLKFEVDPTSPIEDPVSITVNLTLSGNSE